MESTRKVSKPRCISFGDHSFGVLPGPSDRPRRPGGLPLTGVLSLGPSKSCLGKQKVACMRVCFVSRARCEVVVDHA